MRTGLKIPALFFMVFATYTAQSRLVINEGQSVFIPLGFEICAEIIEVTELGSYVSADSSGTCDGAEFIGGGTIILPVELISFSAEIHEDKSVLLIWETASEINNYGFEIERGAVNDENKENYAKVGFVQGAGNSNKPLRYSYKDGTAEYEIAYLYRLRQIDNDGLFVYSEPVEVLLEQPREFKLYQNYPNPFTR